MALTPSLADLILGAIETRLATVYTGLPGRIVSYNAIEQSADVQPLVQGAYLDEAGDRVAETLPVIPRVPIAFPGAGAYSITWPINVGDTVLLVIASCSLDRWLAGGGVVDPANDQRHHLSDAIAIPGLRDFGHVLGSGARDASALVLSAPAIKLGASDATDPVVRKSDLNSFVTEYLAHTHPVPGGTSSAPTSTFTTPGCSPVVRTK